MKFPINNRWTGEVQFISNIKATETTPHSIKLRLAVEWAVKNRANLMDANLMDANLSHANLSHANLTDANLTDANLSHANLTDANLYGVNLTGADLTHANLYGANLTCADLTLANLTRADLYGANLTGAKNVDERLFKHDFWGILLKNRGEIDGLIAAVKEGRIDGSAYSGSCACLMGTIANIRHCDVEELEQRADSPAERWFTQIGPEHTPENHGPSKRVLEWIEEFQMLVGGKLCLGLNKK